MSAVEVHSEQRIAAQTLGDRWQLRQNDLYERNHWAAVITRPKFARFRIEATRHAGRWTGVDRRARHDIGDRTRPAASSEDVQQIVDHGPSRPLSVTAA